jgi:hypothetical protein
MYVLVVALTTLILPVASVLVARMADPGAALIALIGLWFVVWGVGVRLGLAGVRQVLKPEFTARDILGSADHGALLIVRELGFANLAIGVVGLLSLVFPAFVLPAAIYACIFYAAAGALHVRTPARNRAETIAMTSDLWMAVILAGFVVVSLITR